MKETELRYLKVYNSKNIVLSSSVGALLGCSFCFYLQNYLGLTAVLSSALTGLIFSFMPDSKHYDAPEMKAIIYTASFAAMTSPAFLENIFSLPILAILVTSLYHITKMYFIGFGGKLGSIAFVSSIIFCLGKSL